jgi:hypothetical protein
MKTYPDAVPETVAFLNAFQKWGHASGGITTVDKLGDLLIQLFETKTPPPALIEFLKTQKLTLEEFFPFGLRALEQCGFNEGFSAGQCRIIADIINVEIGASAAN